MKPTNSTFDTMTLRELVWECEPSVYHQRLGAVFSNGALVGLYQVRQ